MSSFGTDHGGNHGSPWEDTPSKTRSKNDLISGRFPEALRLPKGPTSGAQIPPKSLPKSIPNSRPFFSSTLLPKGRPQAYKMYVFSIQFLDSIFMMLESIFDRF